MQVHAAIFAMIRPSFKALQGLDASMVHFTKLSDLKQSVVMT